ncbi:hypothetical protein HanIR_Chr04g0175081 [Helianthus annuus]|nr:hypothetical protein HanIR_Chr04g0175081 [Helianthus annuus]
MIYQLLHLFELSFCPPRLLPRRSFLRLNDQVPFGAKRMKPRRKEMVVNSGMKILGFTIYMITWPAAYPPFAAK